MFSLLQRKILFAYSPVHAAKKLIPYLVFIVFVTFTTTSLFDGLGNLSVSFTPIHIVGIALGVGIITALIAAFFVRKVDPSLTSGQKSLKVAHQLYSLSKATRHLERLRIGSHGTMQEEVTDALSNIDKITHKLREKTKTKTNSKPSEFRVVEKMFIYLQILTACFVAFAHGANDVANAIGPVATVINVILHPKNLGMTQSIPTWLLALGGAGIVVGLATWGWRVIETIGRKITELTPTRGFCAEFGAATTILLASKLGFPISTTHCIVGAVLGVGLARGISALNLRTLRDIVVSWVVTIPSAAIVSILFFYLIKAIFGSFTLV